VGSAPAKVEGFPGVVNLPGFWGAPGKGTGFGPGKRWPYTPASRPGTFSGEGFPEGGSDADAQPTQGT
jgi:hypothetical protein